MLSGSEGSHAPSPQILRCRSAWHGPVTVSGLLTFITRAATS